MNKMKLSRWMMMEWLPRDMLAEKYVVGQNLTKDQAAEIIQIIARSVGFKLTDPLARRNLTEIGTPFRDFTTCILLLMHAGDFNNKWRNMLWDTLDPGLQEACQAVMIAQIMGR